MKDIVRNCSALLVLVGTIATGLHYFAKAEDLRVLTQRFDQRVIHEEIMWLMQRRNQLLNKYNKYSCIELPNGFDKDMCVDLEIKIRALQSQQPRGQTGGQTDETIS